MNRRVFILFISIFSFHFCIGQNQPDTTFLLSATNHAIKTYTQTPARHTLLHNGVEHKHYREDVEAEAYLDPDWIQGSIFYDNKLFENVPLMYDMIAQRVVTYFFGQVDIDLITDKVDWFMVNDRKFIYLERGDNAPQIEPSFYELLNDGNVKLYARRKKKMNMKVGEKSVMYSVSGTNQFFLYKEGKYIQVNRKGKLLAALNDKKKELKQFKGKNKIQFGRENREMAIKQYVAHYNELR